MTNIEMDDAIVEIGNNLERAKTILWDMIEQFFERYSPQEKESDALKCCGEYSHYREYAYIAFQYLIIINNQIDSILESLRTK